MVQELANQRHDRRLQQQQRHEGWTWWWTFGLEEK